METKIKKTSKLFETIIETSPVAIIALTAIKNSSDQIIDFAYILANHNAEIFLNKTREELLSSTMLRDFPETLDTGFFDTCVRVMQTGNHEFFEKEYSLPVFTGWIAVRVARFDIGVTFTFYDITEEKKNREEIIKQKLVLEESQTIAHVGTFIFNAAENKIEWTKELYSIYGIPQGTQINFDYLLSFVHPEDKGKILEIYNRALSEKGNYETICRLIIKEKTVKHVWTKAVVSYYENGNVSNIIGTVLDITRLKELEQEILTSSEKIQKITWNLQEETKERSSLLKYAEELKKINIELDKYAYIVAHDLKSPLASVEAILNMIKDEYNFRTLDADGLQFINMAIERVRIMGDMIKEILEGMKSKQKVRQPVNLNELIKTVIAGLTPPSHIKIIIQDNLPIVHCNKLTIVQVFQNILGNAIKFIDKEKGIIKIACEETQKLYQISISDNGRGIKKELLPRIFEMFQSGESGQIESTGIGLAIVKKTIDEHNGKIWVESEEDIGSTFYFTLPK